MSVSRTPVRAVSVAATALLALTLLPAATFAGAVPGPIHAGNTYGWYHDHNVWRQEFIGPKPSFWHARGGGSVRDQHGMLTLNTGKRGDTSATLARVGHRTGRWEIRLRSRRYETGHTNYKVMTELIPAGSHKQYCGARNIGLEHYRIGSHRAKFYIHTRPHNTFHAFRRLTLHNDQWHTFAVEVTRKHISWFVDAHVVRTERRSAALSSVPFTVRFTMQSVPGARMNRSRMQMDWLRYWTYNRPSTKSIKAPETKLGYFRGC